jgi:asparagine synthase (glutamine-hydrolysing)
MCGICGIFNNISDRPVQKSLVEKMTSEIIHRGPDDEGYYFSGSVGLGFRRLSIIDLQGGHQPMSDSEGKIWIVFNGEIYNFPELRDELISNGFAFRTKCDTEVIINGYKKWGIDVLQKLNGMFGFAIWDETKQRLIVARDRMGIKLVYYKIDEEGISFASEVKALLATTQMKPEIDTTALNLFLRYRFTPSPLTIYKGIKKLAPGTMVIVQKGSSPKVERWYNFAPKPFYPMPKIQEVKEELLEHYKKAVKRQLISDVPVGLLLSGGVDSAMLLAMMKLYGDNWKTFTVGYGDVFKDDELADARESATLLNNENISVRIDQKTFEESLPAVIKYLEEPVATSSVVPMYHVCQRASEDLKVALIGQGPDELFGGYTRHLGVRYGGYWRSLPRFPRNLIGGVLDKFSSNETIKRSLYSLDTQDRVGRYQQVLSLMQGNLIDGLFIDGLLEEQAGNKILDCWSDLIPLIENTDELGGFQFLEVRSTLPDELLMYADKLSMAHSLELRVPYLDHEIVEYVERLSESFKIHKFSRKYIHKQVCKEYLPNKIIKRKKRGFAVNVVDDWFRSSFTGKINDYLSSNDSLIYNFLNRESILNLLREHQQGKSDNHKVLFSIVLLEEFLRNNLD